MNKKDTVCMENPLSDSNTASLANQRKEEESIVIRRVQNESKDPTAPPPSKKQGLLYNLLDSLRFISIGLLIGILLVVFVIQRNEVSGISMEPTLHTGDTVFVELLTLRFRGPKRFDIVTVDATDLSPAYDKKDKLIKRIIGLPGETISIRDGRVYVDDKPIEEPYLASEAFTYVNAAGLEWGFDHITLEENEYYCLGDNRGASIDSRMLGPIPKDRIKSIVLIRVYPFDQITFLNMFSFPHLKSDFFLPNLTTWWQ